MARKISALQCLSEMEKIKREIDAPSIPAHYIVGTKFTDRTANGLTKAIISFINFSGMQAERINNTGRMVDKTKIVENVLGHKHKIGSIEWQKGTGTKGTGDISATVKGMSVKIEVKIGKDRQSEDQVKYQDHVTSAGGIYIIAKEFAPFVKWYCEKFGRPEILNTAIKRLRS